MQIETIIINTSLIQIKEKSIPENFLKSGNASYANQLNMNEEEKIKKNLNNSAEDVRPLKNDAKFPSLKFNTIDFLKPLTKK